jgi:hypothetical protein
LKYELLIERRVQKQLARISQPHQDRIIAAIRQNGKGSQSRWRLTLLMVSKAEFGMGHQNILNTILS